MECCCGWRGQLQVAGGSSLCGGCRGRRAGHTSGDCARPSHTENNEIVCVPLAIAPAMTKFNDVCKFNDVITPHRKPPPHLLHFTKKRQNCRQLRASQRPGAQNKVKKSSLDLHVRCLEIVPNIFSQMVVELRFTTVESVQNRHKVAPPKKNQALLRAY